MVKDEPYFNSITEQIIGCAYKVSNSLGAGFLEKVYENALAYELEKSGLQVACQRPVKVLYCGITVGEYYADLMVNDEIIIELKTAKSLEDAHSSQCLNYLRATGMKIGLLINFGLPKIQVKRIVNRV